MKNTVLLEIQRPCGIVCSADTETYDTSARVKKSHSGCGAVRSFVRSLVCWFVVLKVVLEVVLEVVWTFVLHEGVCPATRTLAPNSGGRTPGSKLPASPPPRSPP